MKNKKTLIISTIILVVLFTFVFISKSDILKLKGTVNYTNSYSNNNIKIQEPNDNNFNGNVLNYFVNDIKLINVEVQIPEDSILEKVEIDLKEGMTYISYPVKPVDNKVDNNFEKLISQSDTLYNMVKSTDNSNVKKETRKDLALQIDVDKSAFGKIIYNVEGKADKIEIPINVGVDFFRYYHIPEGRTIEDFLSVKATYKKEDSTKYSKVSSIDADLYSFVNGEDKFYRIHPKSSTNSYSTEELPSTQEQESIGYTKVNSVHSRRIGVDAEISHFIPYYKKAELTIYYPKYTTFVDLVDSSHKSYTNSNPGEDNSLLLRHDIYTNDYCSIVTEEVYNSLKDNDVPYCYIVDYNNNSVKGQENYIKVHISKYTNTISHYVAVKYRVNENVPELTTEKPFEWTSTKKDVMKLINYDNTESIYNSSQSNYLKIIHPNNYVNRIQARKNDKYFYNKEDMIVFSPSFEIWNTTVGEKTNQILEFEIPARFEAFKVTIPKSKMARFLNIEYKACNKKTNVCDSSWKKLPETYYEKSQASSIFYLKNSYIDDDYESVYFTNVRAKVDFYPEGYKSSASSNLFYSNAVVYGIFKKNVDMETIKLKLCNGNNSDYENDCNLYEASVISNVGKSNENKRNAVYSTHVSFYNSENKKMTAVTGGEKFILKGTLSAHLYPYYEVLNIYNAVIYLRQPKGYTIEIDDLILKYGNENIIPYIRKIQRENDVIYVIETNKHLGENLNKYDALNNHNRSISINVAYSVNEDFDANPNVLNVSDLVTISGNPFPNSSEKIDYIATEDIFNLDNDESTNKIAMFGTDRIGVQPKDGFIVSSSIIKDGEEYLKYNENNDTTFVDVFVSEEQNYQENFIHKIKILNNTKEEIKENTAIYIPIAKDGYKYYYTDNINTKTYIQDNPNGVMWDAILNSVEADNEFFDIFVAELPSDNKDINVTTLNYNKINDSNTSKAGMVKLVIKNGKKIESKESVTVNIHQIVKGNQSKHLKENVYNPVLYYNSSTGTGMIDGNKVGLKLYNPVITLDLYHDKNGNNRKDNNEDFIYDENITVDLLDSNYRVIDDAIKRSNNYTYYVDNRKLKPQEYSIRINLNDSSNKFLSTADKYIIKSGIKMNNQNGIYSMMQGLINYNLGFTVPNKLDLYASETKTIKIEDISPEFYDKISDGNLFTLDYDSSLINVVLDGDELRITSTNKEIEYDISDELKITMNDKYGNSLTKSIIVEVSLRNPPILSGEKVELIVGQEIYFGNYIEAKTWTDKPIEIRLADSQKNNTDSNTYYRTNAGYMRDFNGNFVATKTGDFKINYFVIEKLYGSTTVSQCIEEYQNTNICLASMKTIDLHVEPLSNTVDNIIVYIVLFAGSIIGFIIALIIAIRNKKNR